MSLLLLKSFTVHLRTLHVVPSVCLCKEGRSARWVGGDSVDEDGEKECGTHTLLIRAEEEKEDV